MPLILVTFCCNNCYVREPFVQQGCVHKFFNWSKASLFHSAQEWGSERQEDLYSLGQTRIYLITFYVAPGCIQNVCIYIDPTVNELRKPWPRPYSGYRSHTFVAGLRE